jgi:competence protein ComEA
VVTCLVVRAGVAATLDVNRATRAELEAISGIGPDMATRLIDARERAAFKDWADLRARVRGVGPANAARWSRQGLAVDGRSFDEPAAAASR